MSYFVGLDVSQKTTFVCIVDQKRAKNSRRGSKFYS
jgi:hypothetical protein